MRRRKILGPLRWFVLGVVAAGVLAATPAAGAADKVTQLAKKVGAT